ncbi:MAG: CRISPR system precrRNA processing endoribonuclease RAMP protein Cas6 [Magnetococcales bacterium]|nr:CRISPR system precrRNA processing endoribonuclease RAMP protein Cas6 [Magnetococcales bacterium]
MNALIRLPEYAGSSLRGVFGSALRQVCCLTGMAECLPCSLRRTCPYATIFELPPPVEGQEGRTDLPNPYVIEPPPWGARHFEQGALLTFHLVLVGRALSQLSLLILAWQRALARGIGPGDGTARLQRVVLETPGGDEEIFTLDEGGVREHLRQIAIPPWPGVPITLHFITPTRIQKEGRPMGPERLTPREWLLNLSRRVERLAQIHAGTTLSIDPHHLIQRAEAVSARGRLHWHDWTRRSSRQQRVMTLGGVTGRWTLSGDALETFWPFLYLGQWLHVGKNATFGLGHYRIETSA